MSKLYKSWRDFPMPEWRWPNFSPQEVASKGEGELLIDPASGLVAPGPWDAATGRCCSRE